MDMSLREVVVGGTLKPDGTLELDQKPDLSPGRVEVVLRPVQEPAPAEGDWWSHLQRVRAERGAAGYPFMNEEEVTAYVEDLRADDDRTEEAYRQAEEARKNEERSE
jgi:hypothetical protein